MMRKFVISTVVFFLIILTGCSLPGNRKARVLRILGEVSINGKEAVFEQKVAAQDVITTGKDSVCYIQFHGKNIIRVGEQSECSLDLTGPAGKISLRSGSLLHVLHKLRSAGRGGERFVAEMPNAVVGVRGTSFYLKVEDPDNSYICNCNGIVETRDINGESAVIIKAKNHAGVRFTTLENGNISRTPAEMLYHTDQDNEETAALIHEEIDWTSVSGEK